MGFEDLANMIAKQADVHIDEPLVLRKLIELVRHHDASKSLWITRIKHPHTFNLMDQCWRDDLFLVVLKGSDGSSQHAVTLFRGMIFDSNELFALHLKQETLDLLCSTSTHQVTCLGISVGYIFEIRQEDITLSVIPAAQNLKIPHSIHFHQPESCIFASFASAIFILGFTETAVAVASLAHAPDKPSTLKDLAAFVRSKERFMMIKRIRSPDKVNLFDFSIATDNVEVFVLQTQQ